MDRSKIIEDLYRCKEIAKAIKKMRPVEIQDDLRQEMFVSLCHLPDEKFWLLHENNALRFYLIRAMMNMINSTKANQPFFKNFRSHAFNVSYVESGIVAGEDSAQPDYLTELDQFDLVQQREEVFDRIDENRAKLTWYESKLLDTYIDLGFNYKEVERQTMIPYMSVVRTIRRIKDKIK